MKKITLVTLLSVAILSTVSSHSISATTAGAARQVMAGVGRVPDMAVMEGLAPAIADPALLAAWRHVYQQQAVIQLGGGVAVSGRSLAQFVLDHDIPVVWNTSQLCDGSSCSMLVCTSAHCTYGAGAPIYIRRQDQVDAPGLTSTLAHEIFHRTQPFGPVGDTRYEEYLAFLVGARVAQTNWPSFEGYNPLDPDQLNVWFRENRMPYYLQIPAYPVAVADRIYRVSGVSDPYAGLPPAFYGTPQTR